MKKHQKMHILAALGVLLAALRALLAALGPLFVALGPLLGRKKPCSSKTLAKSKCCYTVGSVWRCLLDRSWGAIRVSKSLLKHHLFETCVIHETIVKLITKQRKMLLLAALGALFAAFGLLFSL